MMQSPPTPMTPQIRSFTVHGSFGKQLEKAMDRAKTGKEIGQDGVHNEMVKVAPKEMTDLLMEIWRKVGERKLMIEQWERGIFTAIHKAVEEEKPKNHRPICILSNPRKLV